MHSRNWILGLALTGLFAATASAQGLILSLPPDGTWVRYEGTYAHTEIRPESALGKLEVPPWSEHVTIKSVGVAMAEFLGETVPCRWLEIKVERGREVDGKIATGKTGLEIYKVLVPESVVTENPVVEEGVPIGFLPIVRGARVIGDGEPQPLSEAALKLYPLGVLFSFCRNLEVEEDNSDPGTGLGPISATLRSGTKTLERLNSRTEMTVKIWTSPDVPFGVAAWNAQIIRSVKDSQKGRDEFQPLTQVDVELKARGTGDDAQSEVDFN